MKTNVIIEWHSASKKFNEKKFKIYTCNKIKDAETLIEKIANKFVEEKNAKKLNKNKRCQVLKIRNFEITIYTVKP